MPYDFNFDLSNIPRSFFRELTRVVEEKQLPTRFGLRARSLAEKFKLSEATGLDVQNVIQIVEDLVDVQVKNANQRAQFNSTEKRALFLPHCSRKHMDSSCRAVFEAGVPTYRCEHCSEDCLVSQATTMGEGKGYAVFVVPGGSCIPEIIKKNNFDALIGVACGQELIPAFNVIKRVGLPTQAVPLIKNGCANTVFSLPILESVL